MSMTPELEKAIRTEIARSRVQYENSVQSGNEFSCACWGNKISALEWVLSLAKPQDTAPGGDDEKIVEAMVEAAFDAEFGHGTFAVEKKLRTHDELKWPASSFVLRFLYARAALAVARQHLVPQVRAKALDDAGATANSFYSSAPQHLSRSLVGMIRDAILKLKDA